jgi:hypothetical protein
MNSENQANLLLCLGIFIAGIFCKNGTLRAKGQAA